MAKNARSLTQEFELSGQRLTLALSDTGLSIKLDGSRKSADEVSWASLINLLAAPEAQQTPTDVQVAAALQALGAAPAAAAKAAAPAAGHPSVGALLERLEKWFAKNRKRYLKKMPGPATDADLDALQKVLGRPVPDDLRTLLSWHNGQGEDFDGCFCEQWYLLGTKQIADFYAQMLKEEKDQFRPEWAPFLNDDRDNCVFLDTTQAEPPVRQFWQKNKQQPTVAPSLAAWLEDFVTGVEAGKFTQDPERGHFVRSE